MHAPPPRVQIIKLFQLHANTPLGGFTPPGGENPGSATALVQNLVWTCVCVGRGGLGTGSVCVWTGQCGPPRDVQSVHILLECIMRSTRVLTSDFH